MSRSHRYHSTFRIPNQLIVDASLSFSARRLGAVLYSRRNYLGCCRKSLAELAKLSGLSVTTIRKAIDELTSAEYIVHIRTHRYNEQLGRMVYDKSVYHCLLPTTKDFTMIPWRIFDAPMTSGAFTAALYLYYQAGTKSRCFPSLAAICQGIGASMATVCRARRILDTVRLFCVLQCRKLNRAFSSNSYHILQQAAVDVSGPSSSAPRPSPGLVGVAPFPCLLKHSTGCPLLQAFSVLRGILKTIKQHLDLDNVRFIRTRREKIKGFHIFTYLRGE